MGEDYMGFTAGTPIQLYLTPSSGRGYGKATLQNVTPEPLP